MAVSLRRWGTFAHSSPSRTLTCLGALFAICVLIAAPVQAQTFTVLHAFTGGTDGESPFSALIQDPAGNLYGTTALGGDTGCNGNGGCGTIYKIDTAGNLTILYAFTGQNGDGMFPYASLTRDAAGNLYGTTNGGGLFAKGKCTSNNGCGTVFFLDPTGKETVLHAFSGMADGGIPYSGVVRDPAGTLYGTTYLGGLYNWGIAYRLGVNGTLRTLHNFNGRVGDGGDVMGGVIRDSSGNLYGATQGGGYVLGPVCDFLGCGVIYKLTPAGTETLLYTFLDNADGASPEAGLVRDAAGNFYGASQGPSANEGTIFKLDPSGNLTTLHTFTGDADGGDTVATLALDNKGNLYGTTFSGGIGQCAVGGCGTVFKLDPTGKLTTLHRFTGNADGGNPLGGLLRDSKGNLYGTTLVGGVGDGVVFKIAP